MVSHGSSPGWCRPLQGGEPGLGIWTPEAAHPYNPGSQGLAGVSRRRRRQWCQTVALRPPLSSDQPKSLGKFLLFIPMAGKGTLMPQHLSKLQLGEGASTSPIEI